MAYFAFPIIGAGYKIISYLSPCACFVKHIEGKNPHVITFCAGFFFTIKNLKIIRAFRQKGFFCFFCGLLLELLFAFNLVLHATFSLTGGLGASIGASFAFRCLIILSTLDDSTSLSEF